MDTTNRGSSTWVPCMRRRATRCSPVTIAVLPREYPTFGYSASRSTGKKTYRVQRISEALPEARGFPTETQAPLARRKQDLWTHRARIELRSVHRAERSITCTQMALDAATISPRRMPRRSYPPRRCTCLVPSDRAQLDTMKIAPAVDHHTVGNCCSEHQVLCFFGCRTAMHTIDFLYRVVEEVPFAVQCVQTDRGREFLLSACNFGSPATPSNSARSRCAHCTAVTKLDANS